MVDMLRISERQMAVLRNAGLRALRPAILAHWRESLGATSEAVGIDVQEAVLDELEAMGRQDPELTQADLAILADLMLAHAASERGSAP